MAVLVGYNFTSDTSPSTTASNVVGSTILGQDLTSFGTDTPGYASDPSITSAPVSGATSAALAVSNDSYMYFSVAPDQGYELDLTSLDFDIARGGAATPRGYDVRSSVDGFAATLGTADISTQRTTYTAVSIDLTGSEFQGLVSAVTFRVYLYAPSDVHNVDMDNISLEGTVSSSGTVNQEGYRFREDDGSESTASWLEEQDTGITRPASTTTRLRVLLDSTNDRQSENYRLEYRKVGDSNWNVIST